MCASVGFSIFTELCNNLLKNFFQPKRKATLAVTPNSHPSPQRLETTNLLSITVDWPILDISLI